MKYCKDWNRILVDTTILCSLFRSENSKTANTQDEFVKKVIEFLSKNKSSSGEDRVILISALTIAELTTNEEDVEMVKRIMKVLNTRNVEIIDFDFEVALAFNAQLQKYLDREYLQKKAVEAGFNTQDFGIARGWITRDYMIAMCGIQNKSDVILTADKKLFYPIVKDVPNSNCVLTYPELFNVSERFIIGYKENEVEAFLKNGLQ